MKKNRLLCQTPHCRALWMFAAGDDEGKPWKVLFCDEHFWRWAEDNPWVYAKFAGAILNVPGGVEALTPS